MLIAARAERGRSRVPRARGRPGRRPIDPARAGAGLLAGGCLAALLWLAGSDALVLRSGQVIGARHTEPAAALRASGLEGARTFRASAAEARARLRSLPAVRDASVDLDVLGTFRIALVEREAAGRWVAGGAEWFIDRDGVLFPSADPQAAPALRIRDDSVPRRQAGDRIDRALLDAALRLAALAPGELRADMRAPSVRIEAGPNGIVLASGGRWELRFGSVERFEDKLAVARQFLRNEPDRPLDYVDVRSPDRIVFSPR
ncbi:MAG: cell division protein FtsQ/DivIB [Candidatus Limnocylindria bacterium]